MGNSITKTHNAASSVRTHIWSAAAFTIMVNYFANSHLQEHTPEAARFKAEEKQNIETAEQELAFQRRQLLDIYTKNLCPNAKNQHYARDRVNSAADALIDHFSDPRDALKFINFLVRNNIIVEELDNGFGHITEAIFSNNAETGEKILLIDSSLNQRNNKDTLRDLVYSISKGGEDMSTSFSLVLQGRDSDPYIKKVKSPSIARQNAQGSWEPHCDISS